ncbi:VacJ family lipoprotein [uncultured Desulfuromonas sp.]|uniref:MlaA family lipoprotein n=1 Tax=uncultured Desulfuromonas sp. TaxID=181013 RepID=UPI002625419D|nr:VacJ family lipoprotein [uncultured Desulfuromonas sp.]
MRRIATACLTLALIGCSAPGAMRGALPSPGAETGDVAAADPEEWRWEEDLDDEIPLAVYDPIQPFNRGVFWINDKLYSYLFKPVARVYRVVPEPARTSVSNVFSNLSTPVRFVNALLQFKGTLAGHELARLFVNTTFGIGGLFDVAKTYGGLAKHDEDFGQTLGHYGVGPGFYLVLPVLGPANLRDGVGRVADLFLDPLYYLGTSGEEEGLAIALRAWDFENRLSLDKDTYESIKEEQIDPYLFIRDAYAQRREAQIEK